MTPLVPLMMRRRASIRRLILPGALGGDAAFSRPSAALGVGSTGVLFGAAENVPRFVGAAGRLLGEGQFAAVLSSSELLSTGWTALNLASRAQDVGPGPDPAATQGWSLVENTTTGAHGLQRTLSAAAGDPLALTAILAPGTRRFVTLYIGVGGGNHFAVQVDTQNWTGTTYSVGVGSARGSRITPLANGWYAVTLWGVLTSFANPTCAIWGCPAAGTYYNPSYAGDGSKIRVWGISGGIGQPGSYVPTAATVPVTRAADALSFALAAAQGTLVGTFLFLQAAPPGVAQGVLCLDDGTNANRLGLRVAPSSTSIVPFRVIGGVETVGASLGTYVPGVPFKAAVTLRADGFSASALGGAAVAMAGALPPVTRLRPLQGRADELEPGNGEAGPLDLSRTIQPDAAMPALTAA